MKRTLLLSIGILALAALVGCGDKEAAQNSKTEKPEVKTAGELEGQSPMDLFPTEVGTQVTYDMTQGGETKELTFVIAESKDVANGKEVTVEVQNAQGEVTDTTVWRLNDKGLSQVMARDDQAFEPPQPLVNFPITFSEPVQYEGVGPYASVDARGKITGENRVRGKELVQTEMGEVEALAVDTAYTWEHQGNTYISRETTWVAPKYGIVRYQQTLAMRDAEGQTGSIGVSLVMKGYSQKG